KPRFRGRLFGAERAAVPAVTTNFSLVAPNHVARHGVHMPAQRAQAAIQNLLASRNAVVLQIDVQSFADGIEASRVLLARKPRHARRGPFRSNLCRRSKRR